jgi:adenine-specific DNA-methyltransferase
MKDQRSIHPESPALEERLRVLKETLPECFSEGRLDPEKLRETLGEENLDEGSERYGLSWPGKREARARAFKPSAMALHYAGGEGVDEEKTKNLIIEGENLEVLRLLQKSYRGRVKMIYIDPPYNTGNDFVYDDKFAESPLEYEKRSGLRAEDGSALQSNRKSSGRYHSNWLSMMYPRLVLARELLSDDGIIVSSIDDNEISNLRALLNEVMGEEGFVGEIIWKSRTSEDARSVTGLSIDHEYLLVYRRSDDVKMRGAEKDLEKFSNPDNDPRGPWRSADLTGLATIDRRPNLHYTIVDPKSGTKYDPPVNGWRYDKNTMKQQIEEERILWPSNQDGRPRHKLFVNEMDSRYKAFSSLITDITTGDGTKEGSSRSRVGEFA